MASTASTNIPTSPAVSPAATACSARRHAASYSSAKATFANNVTLPLRARISKAAEAPVVLRMAATTTLVSSTILISQIISYHLQYHFLEGDDTYNVRNGMGAEG